MQESNTCKELYNISDLYFVDVNKNSFLNKTVQVITLYKALNKF